MNKLTRLAADVPIKMEGINPLHHCHTLFSERLDLKDLPSPAKLCSREQHYWLCFFTIVKKKADWFLTE